MIRILALAAGLFGAVGLSQFPQYSHQYMQRLSGAVDELSRMIQTFDEDAASLGLTRQAALAELAQGGRMGEARALSVNRLIARHARLSAELSSLETSSPIGKLLKYRSFSDPDIARQTLATFEPALPATASGFGFGAVGFGLGYSLILLLGRIVAMPFRRRGPRGPARVQSQ